LTKGEPDIILSQMKNGKNRELKSFELSFRNEIFGIVFLFVSVFLIFSLLNYSPYDPSYFHSTLQTSIENWGGKLGSEISAFLFVLFGYASWAFVFYSLLLTVYFFLNRNINNIFTKSIGFLLFLLSFSSLITVIHPLSVIKESSIKTGGIIGYFLSGFFQSEIKGFLTFLLFFLLVLISVVMMAKVSLKRIVAITVNIFKKIYIFLSKIVKKEYDRYMNRKRQKRILKKYNREVTVEKGDDKDKEKKKRKLFEEKRKKIKEPSKMPEELSLFNNESEFSEKSEIYSAPPLSYLDAATQLSKIDLKELEEKKNELQAKLLDFKISGKILEYTPGPVITTYEFVPDSGVKVKDVVNLSEDLAMVALAQYIRIDRILGKKAIGIEIPNKKREIIHLREIIESEEFRNASSPLTIALGKTKSGEVFIMDLRDMPHVIIAGATGSGKSVAIHTIILSIIYRSSPDEVKLILIDPKRVELAIYNALPHLMTPVVVNPRLAKNALDWAIFEMEKRYRKLAVIRVRNLEQYNKRIVLMEQSGEELPEEIESFEKIPYIVIIIDEFADLMMESSKEIEYNVARIAQKARAVGIHLILATQRPSVDVITGTIKNNFPSRIALAVPSRNDSKTIIDVMGAEKLLGHGDMLVLPPKSATLIRAHCSFVSEDEALRVVSYLSKKAKPKFNTEIIKPVKKDSEKKGDEKLDDKFFEAASTIINSGQASASFLQRKLSIGYARAGRLMDQLENAGVVSAPNLKNQRKILMGLTDLEDFLAERE